MTVEEREDRFRKWIEAHPLYEDDSPPDIQDVLADIICFCRAENIDFDQELNMAYVYDDQGE